MERGSTTAPSAFIDAGILETFSARLKELGRSDTIDSTLFGQLAADKQASRTADPATWLESYFTTLAKVGWSAGKVSLRPWRTDRATFTVREVALEKLARSISPEDLALVDATVVVLEHLDPTTKPRVLFDEYGRAPHAINAQISLSTGSPPVLTTVAVIVFTEQVVTDVLEELTTALLTSDVQTLVQTMTLNEAVYSQVRETIIEKLGPRREELVAEIALNSAPQRRAEHLIEERTLAMKSVSNESKHTAEEIEAYWTPERRARAQPEPTPAGRVTSPGAPPAGPQRDVPGHDPRGGHGAKGSALEPKGDVKAPQPVPHPDEFPWRTIGKLFYTKDGVDREASACVIAKTGLICAAHSLYTVASRAWAKNIAFYPAYDRGGSSFGFFTDESVYVTEQWYQTGENAYDVGVIRMRPRSGVPVGDVVGWLGYSVNRPPERSWLEVGYPGNYYEGQRMVSDEGHFTRTLDGGKVVGKQGTLGPGASGGPWLLYGNNAIVNGVASFEDSTYPGEVFSPYFATWVAEFIQRHLP